MGLNGFKWVKQKRLSKFNDNFIKNMMKIVTKESFKASIKSWVSIKKSTQNNSVQTKSMVKAIY